MNRIYQGEVTNVEIPFPSSYLFTVAQIVNLPYRRFVIGRTLLAGGRWQVKNLRYCAARRSRNQYVPTTDEHGWIRIRESLSSSVLIRVHPWLKKSSRAATISGDTDREHSAKRSHKAHPSAPRSRRPIPRARDEGRKCRRRKTEFAFR